MRIFLGIAFFFAITFIVSLLHPRNVLASLPCTNCSVYSEQCQDQWDSTCTSPGGGRFYSDSSPCNYSGPGTGRNENYFNCNGGYYCSSGGGCSSLSACDGRGWTDGPASGTTMYVGGVYNIAGWSRFCGGPAGQGVRNRQDIHLCQPVGGTTTCRQLTSYVGGFSRPDIASLCWAGTTNTAGWSYNWTIPNTVATGNYTIWSVAINDAATTCTKWLRTDVTIINDSTPPIFNSITPSPASPGSAAAVTFTANVTDSQSGINTISISVNSDTNGQPTGSWQSLGTCNAGGAQTAYNCVLTWNTNVTQGKHLVRVNAADRAPIPNTIQVDTNYYLLDTNRPLYSGLTLSPNSPAYTSQPQITATVADTGVGTNFPSGVQEIDIYYNTDTGGNYTGSWVQLGQCINSVVGTGFSCNVGWPAQGFGGTSHYIAVNTKDFAGNWRFWNQNVSGAADYVNNAPYGHAVYTFLSSYTCN